MNRLENIRQGLLAAAQGMEGQRREHPNVFAPLTPELKARMLNVLAPAIAQWELLPRRGESCALAIDCPKTAALLYDRVDNDTVPDPVRFHCVTNVEILWRVWDYLSTGGGIGTTKIVVCYPRDEAKPKTTTSRMPSASSGSPTDKAKSNATISRKAVEDALGAKLSDTPKWAHFNTDDMCRQLAAAGINMIPVYASRRARDKEYKPGEYQAVVATITNLQIVDEESLAWEQVFEFRKDTEARKKYRRLVHWLDKDMVGKPQSYIEDEISQRLDDYEWALRKLGVETVLGTIEDLLDGKFLMGAAAAGGLTAWAVQHWYGVLASGGLTIGKAGVSLAKRLLELKDVVRRTNPEIAYVHEIKRSLR